MDLVTSPCRMGLVTEMPAEPRGGCLTPFVPDGAAGPEKKKKKKKTCFCLHQDHGGSASSYLAFLSQLIVISMSCVSTNWNQLE